MDEVCCCCCCCGHRDSSQLDLSLPSAIRRQNSSQQKLKSMSSSVLSLGVSQARRSARSDNTPGKAATSSLALILRSPSVRDSQCSRQRSTPVAPRFSVVSTGCTRIPPNAPINSSSEDMVTPRWALQQADSRCQDSGRDANHPNHRLCLCHSFSDFCLPPFLDLGNQSHIP